MEKYAAVILAAGKGTRMNEGLASPIPKVMFPIAGKPIAFWDIQLIRDAGIEKVVLVVGYKKELVQDYFGDNVDYAVQEQQLGTGHAAAAARPLLEGKAENVIVFYGDNPLYKPETVRQLIELYEKENPTIAMLSVEFDDPKFWAFGRLIQDKEGSLKSKQEKIINFTVNVSADADPGGHYAGVFVRKVESATAGQVGVAGRVGTLVLVTVPGQITKKAEIKDFEVPESTFKIQPVDLSARVYNSGNTFYEAKAEIESSSIWGTDKIDLGSHVIPHQNSRSYSASWSPKIPFGLYKLTLRVTDGDGTVHEKNASAWILPYEIVVPFIIIIILIILAIVFALRRKPKDQIGPTPQQV